MAKFEFDPTSSKECSDAQKVIALFQNTAAISTDPENRVDSTTPVAAPVAETVAAPAAEEFGADDIDTHGMKWNADYHSDPATKNADGSWRMKRGKKAELEAAIAAHKSGQVAAAGVAMIEPAPTAPVMAPPAAPAMAPPTAPAPMPAAPAPTAPAAPVSYEQMAGRFAGMVEANTIDVNAAYGDLGVSFDDLQTNQTSIDKFWHYMNALDSGAGHPDAVSRTLAIVAAG